MSSVKKSTMKTGMRNGGRWTRNCSANTINQQQSKSYSKGSVRRSPAEPHRLNEDKGC